MGRILLISSNVADEPYPVYPLGVSTLASSLAVQGHEVDQFDFLAQGSSEQALRQRIADFVPDFVGISIRNVDNVDSFSSERAWYLPSSKRLAEIVRDETDAPLILGGSGFSLLPTEIMDYVNADYGVVGEGELALANIIDGIRSGNQTPRIVSRQSEPLEGRAIMGATWDAKMLSFYRPHSAFGIQTKRGCPYRCAYCTYPILEGGELRCREPGAIVDDLERLYTESGITRFFFADSVFNDGKGHYLAVAEEMVRRALPVSWSAFFCPGKLERSTLTLLKRAGLESVEIGTDGSSDQTLTGMMKPFSFADVIGFQEACRKETIPAAHYVMFGGPDETEGSLKEGISNLERLKQCVIFGFSGIRLFPGTPLYERALDEGTLTRSENLLRPFYYFSQSIDRKNMERRIKGAFQGRRDRIFPPEEGLKRLKVMHRFGFRGALWDRLLSFS